MTPTRLTTSMAVLAVAAALAGACGDESAQAPLQRVDRSLFDYDRGRPLAASSERAAGRQGLAVERIGFRSFDGERVPGLFAYSAASGPGPCLLFGHGFSLAKETAEPLWPSFAAAGVATLSIDARFHGERVRGGIGPARVRLDPELLRAALRGTVIDMRRALDYLARRPECDPKRLGYFGASFGAMAGALLAGADDRVLAPVLIVGGGDWREILDGSDVLLPGVERDPARLKEALRLLEPLDPERWVGHIAPRDVLIVYGTEDQLIAPAAGEALADAARDPKRVIAYPGGHSGFLDQPEVAGALRDWLPDELVRGR